MVTRIDGKIRGHLVDRWRMTVMLNRDAWAWGMAMYLRVGAERQIDIL